MSSHPQVPMQTPITASAISPDATVDTPMIVVRGIKKSYNLKSVLRGIDFVLPRGESMALMGANGAGKTTLLRILAGLTRADAGTFCIEGWDGIQAVQQIRQLVGFVGHQPSLYEELTALENLLFFGQMYTLANARERSETLLRRIGLQKRMRDRVGTFSRGLLQRLAWARALLHEPHLLLLDEPDTGLDQEGNELIRELLKGHTQQGGSTLFTTHQMEYALTLSNNIIILGNGRVVYRGETKLVGSDELREVYKEVVQ